MKSHTGARATDHSTCGPTFAAATPDGATRCRPEATNKKLRRPVSPDLRELADPISSRCKVCAPAWSPFIVTWAVLEMEFSDDVHRLARWPKVRDPKSP